MVALTLGVLVTLAVGVNDVALRRRTVGRAQQALDLAAADAVSALDTASLVARAPALDRAEAESRLRTALARGLAPIAGGIAERPEDAARAARVAVAPAGGTCLGTSAPRASVCAEVTLTLRGVFGDTVVTFATLAQATERP